MPVIGLTFSSMQGERKKVAARGEIKVNSTPKVVNIKEVTVASLGKKALSFKFEFVTKYDPELAQIQINGDLLYMGKSNKKVLDQWKAKKSIPEEVSVEILNHLFRRCLLKIANMADDLQLPPPIQIPRVRPAQKESSTSYVG